MTPLEILTAASALVEDPDSWRKAIAPIDESTKSIDAYQLLGVLSVTYTKDEIRLMLNKTIAELSG